MSLILTIFWKETAVFLNSLIAYVVMTVFLTGIGLFFWIFGENILETGAADLSTLFALGPWFFLFLIPAITMRSFAEEIKTGTLDLMFSRPVTRWQILTGKYLAACALVVFSVIPTLFYFITVWYLGSPIGNLDAAASIGAYIGLLFLGFSFASIGIFASTLTDNQIVAFILAVFICFFIYTGFDFLAELTVFSAFNDLLIQFGLIEHFRSISRGVLDSRDFLFFISVSLIFLLLSDLTLFLRKK